MGFLISLIYSFVTALLFAVIVILTYVGITKCCKYLKYSEDFALCVSFLTFVLIFLCVLDECELSRDATNAATKSISVLNAGEAEVVDPFEFEKFFNPNSKFVVGKSFKRNGVTHCKVEFNGKPYTLHFAPRKALDKGYDSLCYECAPWKYKTKGPESGEFLEIMRDGIYYRAGGYGTTQYDDDVVYLLTKIDNSIFRKGIHPIIVGASFHSEEWDD